MKIELPSNQYSIETDPSTNLGLLNTENNSGLFRSLKSGQVRLNLIDNHAEAKSDTIPKSISSFITISKADYLSIVVKFHNRHNLIINGFYELEVYLFNRYNIYYLIKIICTMVLYISYFLLSHNQSIYIGPNVKIAMHLPEEYFKIINEVKNGSYVVVQPIALGTPKIEARLIEPYHDIRTIARTTVSIYSMVKVTPDVIVFPWHANQNTG